jgi:hypothetical protein
MFISLSKYIFTLQRLYATVQHTLYVQRMKIFTKQYRKILWSSVGLNNSQSAVSRYIYISIDGAMCLQINTNLRLILRLFYIHERLPE